MSRRRIVTAREQAELALPWYSARPVKLGSKDPVNDPNGYLDREPYTYHDLVRRAVGHVEGATPEQHFRGRVWYPAAHDLFHDVSRRIRGGTDALSRNITIASAFSPKTSWGNNIQQAIHFLLHYDGDPAKRHDWQTANIHPQALAKFRALTGRDPRATKKDLEVLANAHKGGKRDGSADLPGFQVLRDPAARAEWMENIATRGMDRVLARHHQQVMGKPLEPVLDANDQPVYKTDENGQPLLDKKGQPIVHKERKPYNPTTAMSHVGIPTLGENIGKAKRVWNAPAGTWKTFLGDLKTRAFHDNIADDTPLRPARTWAQAHKDVMDFNPGLDERESPYYHQAHDPHLAHQTMDDDEGYYQMPIDPETGLPDWRLSKDLRSTCDTQHSRAMTMDHGDWRKTEYEAPPALATGPGYELYDRAVRDATHVLNSKQLDPGKHLLPKQVQAIIWGKHKDENDYFGKHLKLVRQGLEKFVPPLRKVPGIKGPLKSDPIPNYTNDWNESDTEVDDSRRKGVPNWEEAPNYELMDPADGAPLESHKDRTRRLRGGMRILGFHDEDDFPWTWEDHLSGWIAHHFPHRLRTASADPLLASVADLLHYTANIDFHDDDYHDSFHEDEQHECPYCGDTFSRHEMTWFPPPGYGGDDGSELYCHNCFDEAMGERILDEQHRVEDSYKGWDPDANPGADDPRIKGAGRTAGLDNIPDNKYPLNWQYLEPHDEHDPGAHIAVGDNGHAYSVIHPYGEDPAWLQVPWDPKKREHNYMWTLVHEFDPGPGKERELTYHPSLEHAQAAALEHHFYGTVPGEHPGTLPDSNYDADRVADWEDAADRYDEEFGDWEDTEDENEYQGPEPLPATTEVSLKDRPQNGLKWQKYKDGRDLIYHGQGSTSQHQYEVVQERQKDHPYRGQFRMLWHKPGYSGPRGPEAPDGTFQEEHGGLSYHPTVEHALDWAEAHNKKHSWDPENDPFDPRTFGASRDEGYDES